MKILSFLFLSFFIFSADENSSGNEIPIAPETLVCVHAGGGAIHCTYFDDGGDCFIGVDGDTVYTSGPDC